MFNFVYDNYTHEKWNYYHLAIEYFLWREMFQIWVLFMGSTRLNQGKQRKSKKELLGLGSNIEKIGSIIQ